MNAMEKPTLEDESHQQVYRYVERNGTVDSETVREYVDLTVDRFHSVVSDLKHDDYLEEMDGKLRVALAVSEDETYSTAGLEYAIRPARQADLSELVKVIRQVSDEKRYVIAESIAERLLYENAIIRHNRVRSRLFFVATVDEGVVGWTHLDTSPIKKLRHTAQQTVGVLEPYRGYGIGGRLLERGLVWAADNGLEKIYNSLPATNEEALSFLETYGWQTEAIRRNHYLIENEYVDEVMMAVNPAEAKDISGDSRLPRGIGSIDELFSVMGDQYHRLVLQYLQQTDDVASFSDLVEGVSHQTDSDQEAVATRLHHVTLPQLRSHGIVKYDRDDEQIQYTGGLLPLELVDWVSDRERTTD